MQAETFDLENFLPYRLSVLANTVSQAIAQIYLDQHGITVIEWRVIAVLGRYPGLTARDVAARTAMEKVPISRAVKSLEEKGLLTRSTDKEDRRRQPLMLSANGGLPLFREIIPKARDYEERLISALDSDQLRQLDKLLERLQDQAVSLGTANTNAE